MDSYYYFTVRVITFIFSEECLPVFVLKLIFVAATSHTLYGPFSSKHRFFYTLNIINMKVVCRKVSVWKNTNFLISSIVCVSSSRDSESWRWHGWWSISKNEDNRYVLKIDNKLHLKKRFEKMNMKQNQMPKAHQKLGFQDYMEGSIWYFWAYKNTICTVLQYKCGNMNSKDIKFTVIKL